jgi:hypothetical protein
MGCVGVGEGAKGEQSIANQGQQWMGIRAMSKIAGSPSKQKVGTKDGGRQVRGCRQWGARGGVNMSYVLHVNAVIYYL